MLQMMKNTQLLLLTGLLLISQPLLACPDMQGSYETENGGTKLYLQKNSNETWLAAIDIADYPLTTKKAVFVSEKDRNEQPYQALPECTLLIEGFGYLIPHVKGQVYHLHFDSRDFEKVFNNAYILKLSDAPSENIGVNKTASTLPENVLDALKKR